MSGSYCTRSSPAIGQAAAHTSHSADLVPVTATIDLSALRHNARTLQAWAAPAELMAVVKADAYGHGAVPTVRVLREEGVRYFAVARPQEGIVLREAGLETPILVLGAPLPDQLSVYAAHDLDVTVSSPAIVDAVIAYAAANRPLRVHVKLDTGMGRIGLAAEETAPAVHRLADAPGVVLAGLWTHFATADEPESAFARLQLDRFEDALRTLDARDARVHAANTGALFTLGARVRDFAAPLVRTGIALYGLAPTPELAARADLRPVMRLTARVTHLKTVSPGTPVSYGAVWRAEAPTRIATLGVGYGDGYPRLLSGRASVGVAGVQRPVVGTVCMDMCMVDLGPPDGPLAASVQVGDAVMLFGPDGPSTYDVARWAETIPYEICCGISTRVPRHYVDLAPGPDPASGSDNPTPTAPD